MTIDEIKAEVRGQSCGLLTDGDAVMALLANGGVSPDDVESVEVTPSGFGFNIAFVVADPYLTIL